MNALACVQRARTVASRVLLHGEPRWVSHMCAAKKKGGKKGGGGGKKGNVSPIRDLGSKKKVLKPEEQPWQTTAMIMSHFLLLESYRCAINFVMPVKRQGGG